MLRESDLTTSSNALQVKDNRSAASFHWQISFLVISLTGTVVYLNSFQGQFVFDDLDIVNNIAIRQLWPPWPAMFAPQNASRPLIGLSLAINYQISGFDVWSYHALNLIIHLVAALALFEIVRRTLLTEALSESFRKRSFILALIVTVIWTVHPLQTQSVTYVIQRCESMMGMFYLLTLYCAIRSFNSSRKGLWYGAAIAASVGGMLSKQVMVTAPLIVLFHDSLFLSKSFKKALRERWQLYVGLAATWIVVVATTIISPVNETAGFAVKGISPWNYFISEFSVIVHYLRLSLWPAGLVLDYDWPKAGIWEALPYGAVLAALGAITLWALIRRNPAGFLGAWFFIILSVSSSFLPFSDLAFEHRMYLPLAAVIVLVVSGGFALMEHLFHRLRLSAQRQAELSQLIVLALVAPVIVSLGFLTALRNMDYYHPLVIWKDVIAKRPENGRAYSNVGRILAESGHLEEALDYFYKACEYHPRSTNTHSNLGQALIEMGRFEEGKAHLLEAIRLKPDYEYALYNLGCAYAFEGNLDDAVRYLSQTLEVNPNHEEAYLHLGKVFERQGKNSEATACYRHALQIDPQWPKALGSLALALTASNNPEMKDTNEAIRLAKMAVDLTGGQDIDLIETLAATYAAAGRIPEAIEATRQAYEVALKSEDQKKAAAVEVRLQSYQTRHKNEGHELTGK